MIPLIKSTCTNASFNPKLKRIQKVTVHCLSSSPFTIPQHYVPKCIIGSLYIRRIVYLNWRSINVQARMCCGWCYPYSNRFWFWMPTQNRRRAKRIMLRQYLIIHDLFKKRRTNTVLRTVCTRVCDVLCSFYANLNERKLRWGSIISAISNGLRISHKSGRVRVFVIYVVYGACNTK